MEKIIVIFMIVISVMGYVVVFTSEDLKFWKLVKFKNHKK